MNKFIQAFKQKDTRRKIILTIFILLLYRIGTYIPVPGIPFHEIATTMDGQNSNGVLAMLNLFAGGALGKLSLLSLGIMPYITSSIIMQLMGLVFPKIAAWKKEGGEGRRQIVKWTRFLTIVLGIINAIGYDLMFQAQYHIQYSDAVPAVLSNLLVIFSLLVGVIVIMWMGEIITQHGIGNGMSIIIFTNVCSSVPASMIQSIQTSGEGITGILLTIAAVLLIIIVLPLIVYVERAQRRVPIKSSKQGSNAGYARKANTNYIPIPVDLAGVYALIFSSCFTMLPVYGAALFPDIQWLQTVSSSLTSGPINWVITFFLVIAFCYFMAGVNFNTEDISENLKKQGSFIPGVRPGASTASYLTFIVNHLTLFGSIFIACLAVVSSMLFYYTNNQVLQCFGGTSILIMVSVALQFMAQIEQNLRATNPEAVLKRLG